MPQTVFTIGELRPTVAGGRLMMYALAPGGGNTLTASSASLASLTGLMSLGGVISSRPSPGTVSGEREGVRAWPAPEEEAGLQ